MEASQARITVQRRAGGYTDRARAYAVLIDGQEVVKIKAGESHEATVAPGTHEVQMKIDWALSPAIRLDLQSGEHVRLHTYPNANPLTALWYTTVARKKYLALEREAA